MKSRFENYSEEDIYIDSIYSTLNNKQNDIRFKILNFIIDNSRKFDIENDQLKGYSKSELIEVVNQLKEEKRLVLNDNKVEYIYPVSSNANMHKVTMSDDRSFHPMCAVDGMGAAFTFKQDIKLTSKCAYCSDDVEVEIKDGKLEFYSHDDLHVLHVDLNSSKDWAGSC